MAEPHLPQPPTARSINAILGDLIAQRQLLRDSPAARELLAANGASIAYWQSKLRETTTRQRMR